LSEIRANTISDTAGTGPVTLTKQSAAKSYVHFNGSGTVSIRDSLNVSSITDDGTGQYDINFSTNCNNADYAITGTSGATNHSGWNIKSSGIQSAPTYLTAAAVRITTENTDSYYVSFIAFGDWS